LGQSDVARAGDYYVSSITDTVNEDTGKFNTCSHTKLKLGPCVGINAPPYVNEYVYDTRTVLEHITDYPVPSVVRNTCGNNIRDLGDFPMPPMESALISAYANMKPDSADLFGGANIIQFIAELRDYKHLAKTVFRKGRAINKLKDLCPRVPPKWTVAELSKYIASASAELRLSWSFAIKPTIADIQNIYYGIRNLEKQVKAWNKLAASGKYQTRHFDMSPLLRKYIPSAGIPSLDGWVTTCFGYDMESHATLRYKALPMSLAPFKGLKKYHDIIGAGKGISILWELIPFSFLVDYVTSVGDYLHQYDEALVELPISEPEMGYSIKRIAKWTSFGTFHGGYGVCPGSNSHYFRSSCTIPNLENEPWRTVQPDMLYWKPPKLGQLINVVALVAAFLNRRG
jgi:hypothetical protein